MQRVNAMFAEQYVLLMMQDKLETEGGGLRGRNGRLGEAEAKYSAIGRGRERYPKEYFAELPEDMTERYIEKIEVYDEQYMEIRWKDNAGQN